MRQKIAAVEGREFCCLPGHVTLRGRGIGSSLRVAVVRAVQNMLSDRQLRRKHVVGGFKLSVVVTDNNGARTPGKPSPRASGTGTLDAPRLPVAE
jgi:hypothetical protein